MKVGFTSTQLGMSIRQCYTLAVIAKKLHIKEFHHGCCIGGDEEAHKIIGELNIWRVLHPPQNTKKIGLCPIQTYETVYAPKPYIKRNHCIVDKTELLIAAPSGPERLRSGTWATIRYARSLGRPIIILDR